MTDIYIIRHGEAEGNIYRRLQGQYDSLLTPTGLRQVEALEQRLLDVHIDACFSSDLTRACMTAQAVCRPRKLPLHRCPEFREVGLGEWEDAAFGELHRFDAERMRQYVADPLNWHVEGSERYLDYTRRFIDKMEELAREYDGKAIAITTHSCVIRGVQMRLFFDDDISRATFCENTAVSLLRYDNGRFEAIWLNDGSHLANVAPTSARQTWWQNRGKPDYNLWFRPAGDTSLLRQLYHDTWQRLYGSERELDDAAVQALATAAADADPKRFVQVMRRDTPVGVMLMRDGPAADAGWISFMALQEDCCGVGLGAQLLGHAVSYFRAAGCNRLQLAVSGRNERAMAFYHKYGFRKVGQQPGAYEPLSVLEMDIDLTHADVPPEA